MKITVLKTTFDRALAAEYGVDGLTACSMLKEGQVFYADYAKPAGFCDEAWKAIYQYVFALSHGAGKELFYYGDWIKVPASPYAAVTTACAPSSSNWRRPIFPAESITLPSGDNTFSIRLCFRGKLRKKPLARKGFSYKRMFFCRQQVSFS